MLNYIITHVFIKIEEQVVQHFHFVWLVVNINGHLEDFSVLLWAKDLKFHLKILLKPICCDDNMWYRGSRQAMTWKQLVFKNEQFITTILLWSHLHEVKHCSIVVEDVGQVHLATGQDVQLMLTVVLTLTETIKETGMTNDANTSTISIHTSTKGEYLWQRYHAQNELKFGQQLTITVNLFISE